MPYLLRQANGFKCPEVKALTGPSAWQVLYVAHNLQAVFKTPCIFRTYDRSSHDSLSHAAKLIQDITPGSSGHILPPSVVS